MKRLFVKRAVNMQITVVAKVKVYRYGDKVVKYTE